MGRVSDAGRLLPLPDYHGVDEMIDGNLIALFVAAPFIIIGLGAYLILVLR
jgi:hypothetical protein